MKLTIIRIENEVVTCELEGGGLIDIGTRWLSKDIQIGDKIEFEYEKSNRD
jgi:hypothetical protein